MNWHRLKIILLALFVSGCAVKEADRDILRIRLKEDPTTLDPIFIVDVVGGSVAAKLYSGLVRFNENCQIIPDVAEFWDISNDGIIYTFKLRLNAEIVRKAFERVIAESPRKWIFNKVKEFKIIDDFNLQIILKEPFNPFLSLLTMPNAYVGDGPYKLVSWEHDQRIVLEPNLSYFGEPAKVKRIEYLIIPEEFTAKTEFDTGNIDVMELSPIQWTEISKISKAAPRKFSPKLYSQTGLNIYYIGFNCRRPLFKNVKLRQAFNYAIDRELIIKNVLYGQAEPAWGPVPSMLLKNKESYQYNYLPNKARKLLGGKYVIFENPIRLYVRAQTQAIQIAEVVQHYLSEAGVRVIISPLEWSAFKKAVNEGEADMFLMSWWADYPDPENFLFPTFHSSNIGAGGNRAQFKNRIIDELIEEVQKSGDHELYLKLERYISRQAPWIFLWNTKELMVTQPWIKGFKQYPVYNSDKGTDAYISN